MQSRLNELLSQIRLQNQSFAASAGDGGQGQLDEILTEEIKSVSVEVAFNLFLNK